MQYLKALDKRWLTVWTIIYLSFLTIDIIDPSSPIASVIKYFGILLVVVYAHKTARADNLLLLALLFTFLADTILVWTNYFVPGIFVFCFAHFFHIARFTKSSPKLLITFYLIITSIFCFALIQGLPPVYAIAIVYALSLATNVVLSSNWHKSNPKNPQALLAAIGFLLFFFCDLFVGIQYLSSQHIVPANLYGLATFLVWAFYYPSQILISNSSNLTKQIPPLSEEKPSK